MNKIAEIQRILGVEPDGIFGPKSYAALESLMKDASWNQVKASSFADPADVERFRKAKAAGLSDQEAFKVGDNGIGCFKGFDCAGGPPACALPRDDWMKEWKCADIAALKRVIVRANGREVECVLGDTMPWKKNIRNGAGIDLNPAACAALGVKPPCMIDASWRWA